MHAPHDSSDGEVLWPIATLVRSGLENEVVHIKNVRRGSKDQFINVHCGRPMIARKGELRKWHFGHKPDPQESASCGCSRESIAHYTAKYAFQAGLQNAAANHLAYPMTFPCSLCYQTRVVDLAEIVDAPYIVVEKQLVVITRPDVTLPLLNNPGVIAVEIVVTNAPSQEKKHAFEQAGICYVTVRAAQTFDTGAVAYFAWGMERFITSPCQGCAALAARLLAQAQALRENRERAARKLAEAEAGKRLREKGKREREAVHQAWLSERARKLAEAEAEKRAREASHRAQEAEKRARRSQGARERERDLRREWGQGTDQVKTMEGGLPVAARDPDAARLAVSVNNTIWLANRPVVARDPDADRVFGKVRRPQEEVWADLREEAEELAEEPEWMEAAGHDARIAAALAEMAAIGQVFMEEEGRVRAGIPNRNEDDPWWGPDIDRVFTYRGYDRHKRGKSLYALEQLLATGWRRHRTIQTLLCWDWDGTTVLADPFGTPGVVRLLWDNPGSGNSTIARQALNLATCRGLPAWFPFDSFNVTPAEPV